MLSLITINFNNHAGLKRTLDSVNSQAVNFKLEHIIIDGASQDLSLDIAENYKKYCKNVILISEKDTGIYNAMNKGLKTASGSHIAFLNSGDTLSHRSVLQSIYAEIENNSLIDFVYGNVCFVDSNGALKRKWSAGNFNMFKLYFGWMPPHPMTTIRKSNIENSDNFNEKLKIAADYDLMLKLLLRSETVIKYIPDTFVNMEIGGVSNESLCSIIKANIEVIKSWKSNYGILSPYWIFITKPLSKIFQIKWNRLK